MAVTVGVSVCIPVYNGEETIARTISSVLAAQKCTANSVEIIIVDDNSTDRTIENIKPFLRYDHVRLERNVRNLGLAGNWQRALSLGTGQIVTLLHMDDWYGPECLQVVSSAFAEDPALAMLASGQTFYNQDGCGVPFTTHRIATFTGHEYADFQLQFCECPAPSTSFFRRSMLEKVKPYFGDDYLWCPELDLYIRLALANPTANFRHCPEKLVHRTAADPNRFSLRFPGLAAIDACTVVVRFGDNPSSSSAHLGGRRAGARRRIANAIAGVLLQRDIAQLLRVICHPSVRRWLARDLWGFAYVLGNISARSVRRVFRRRNQ